MCADVLAGRALKWAGLRRKQNVDKKVAITVFSFPPDKGNVGTAAYLNVFGSIYECLKTMKESGYDLGKELPESVEVRAAKQSTQSSLKPVKYLPSCPVWCGEGVRQASP